MTALVERATETDGVRPLSEHVALHLRYGGDTAVRHVLAYDGDVLLGYAHLDPTDVVAGSSAELVVDPAQRGPRRRPPARRGGARRRPRRTAPAVVARRPPRRRPLAASSA